jgi:hypothetical protein
MGLHLEMVIELAKNQKGIFDFYPSYIPVQIDGSQELI